MADTGAGSAKRKREELTKKQRKAKRDSDRAQSKTWVNLGQSFNRWRELWDLKWFKTSPELALFLLACNMFILFMKNCRTWFCSPWWYNIRVTVDITVIQADKIRISIFTAGWWPVVLRRTCVPPATEKLLIQKICWFADWDPWCWGLHWLNLSYYSHWHKVRLRSCRSLSSRRSCLLVVRSEVEGTYNLMLGVWMVLKQSLLCFIIII